MEKEKIEELLNLADKFVIRKTQRPCYINVLNFVHDNENLHSRILCGFFQLRDKKGEYSFLNCFLSKIRGTKFQKLHFAKPIIAAEKDRIDVSVMEYGVGALIIENKINGAGDQTCDSGNYAQEGQLHKYIRLLLEKGYRKEQIYILYLVENNLKSPDNNSWRKKDTDDNYKKEFEERFLILSYRDDILNILKEILSEYTLEEQIDNEFLIGSLKLYIDFLEGRYGTNKRYRDMKEILYDLLGIDKQQGANEQHAIFKAKLKNINNIADSMATVLENLQRQCWSEWEQIIKEKYPERFNKYKKDGIGITYPCKGINGEINVEIMLWEENGIRYGFTIEANKAIDNQKFADISSELGLIHEKNSFWYEKITSYQNGLQRLLTLIDKIEKTIR